MSELMEVPEGNAPKKPEEKPKEDKSSKGNDSKVIGVLTSGGDSQGMNAVIRAIVRFGLFKKFKVYLIFEGYNGLFKGEDFVKEANLSSVDHIIHKGGTFIGSSRCKEFREQSGRIKAVLTLIKKGISNLVVIGGDGSLTGANLLRSEWNSILNNLLESGKISAEEKNKNKNLNIIGIVATIDNDFCRTEITTGADTALHRIIEAIDAIATTATSHQRAMIIEVMGYNCGYLALVSALATEATFTFLPESPPPENWPELIGQKIEYECKNGRRLNIIIVSEGALDLNGNPITCEDVKRVVADKTKRDVRITILGHIQRGGHASAYDRILGSRLGAAAIVSLEKTDPNTESTVLTINGNKITGKPLMECVEKTRQVGVAMKNKDWEKCIELRGKGFGRNLETFLKIHKKEENSHNIQMNVRHFSVIQLGEPSPGMNGAVLSFVRILHLYEQNVFGIRNGFEGLLEGKFVQMKWSDVNAWTCQSGALLGTSPVLKRISRKQFRTIAQQITKTKIKGMLVIGGFVAFDFVRQVFKARKEFSELQIPFCVIPATVWNNVPGSQLCLGTDSTLNKTTQLCTDIIISTRGTKGRVYIVQIGTSFCGYLTVMSAIASDADYCYIYEKQFNENDIKRDANTIKNKMIADNRNRLIVMNAFANHNLRYKTIANIYKKEGKGVFTVVPVDISHLMQCMSPSPFDRIFGIKLGVRCAEWFRKNGNLDHSFNAVVIGITEKKYSFTPIEELIKNTDFELEIPKSQWFVELIDLINECS